MITESTMYWVTRLDSIKDMLDTMVIASGILTAAGTIFAVTASAISCADPTEESKQTAKVLRRCNACITLAFAVFGSAAALTPTSKEFAVIKVVPMIANSEALETVSKDGKEIYSMGIEALKNWIKGTKEK
jgi:hypothetical protein